jgi:DNA-directed RNA polymerase subunit RPC12/RpoP
MSKEAVKAQNKCVECGADLKLYEIDYVRNRRILQCPKCGLFHFYRKDFWGRWKLVKAGRVSDLWRNHKR